MTNITADAVDRLAFELGLTNPDDFLLVRPVKAHEIASTLRLLSRERETLQSAIHDMAKNIWRGDWNRLEQETRDVVERVMKEREEERMKTKFEILKDIRANLKDGIRKSYEEGGRPFTEADLNKAEYEILSALAQRHLGGGPMPMGEKE